jgi:hypothetical protein
MGRSVNVHANWSCNQTFRNKFKWPGPFGPAPLKRQKKPGTGEMPGFEPTWALMRVKKLRIAWLPKGRVDPECAKKDIAGLVAM